MNTCNRTAAIDIWIELRAQGVDGPSFDVTPYLDTIEAGIALASIDESMPLAKANILISKLVEALERFETEWLSWPAKNQPDPRITMYDTRNLHEIRGHIREALDLPELKAWRERAKC